MNTNYLEISQVGVTFKGRSGSFHALSDVSFEVTQGEFVSIIGHSGCGKSTILNLVAGLLEPTAGGIILDGREINGPGPDRAVVFQNHNLLPWFTVFENVYLAVEAVFGATESKAQLAERTRKAVELVGLQSSSAKKPGELSGGMKQRVGIARALAMEPKVLLMDEPFGALDALTRAKLQDELVRISAQVNNTVVMITHDVDECLLLSDKVVMMTNGPAATIGKILKVDLPRPRNRLELAENPTYNRYRHEILAFLYERQTAIA